LWVWVVLLPFNIDNQRRPAAIEEDKINRPWRPLPAKRMSPLQATRLEVVLHTVAVMYSFAVGGLRQSLTGVFLGWIYNGLGGADRSCIMKNAVNALGYVTFSMGALSVASQGALSQCGARWFWVIGAVVFTTVQMQDLPDMAGDATRGRRTVPLVIGPRSCRWSIALLVPFWTAVAILFWGSLSLRVLVCAYLALVTSWRVIFKTHTSDDKSTFRIWNLWMVSMYVLPLGYGAPRLPLVPPSFSPGLYC
jgi:4-hydroxybenzoate polyprenyltransferase